MVRLSWRRRRVLWTAAKLEAAIFWKIVMTNPKAPVEDGLIRAMVGPLRHRGPDDEGILAGEGFGLGHCRLAIIDLSDRARQPMANERGSLHLVFNGEIYNYLELKTGLEQKGHRFRSRTDSEVIIHLYEDHGPECLRYLRGMFAFAIYDSEEHTLFAARDRVGKKPLVYAQTGDALLFGSEIKAILEDPCMGLEPDFEALHHYLSYQYVPAPWTAFKGIKKLPPAHYLFYRSGRLEIRPYWRLSFADPLQVKGPGAEADLAEQLLEKFRESVRIRLVSDVPLGAFLSGGVDSSAVVALMSECAGGRVKTFSIGFEDEQYDESSHARDVAKLFETEHTELMVKPDAVSILPKLVWHYNEPFADSSGIPSFYLSELAAGSVRVVLNGDGGDENFAGYLRYRAHALADRLSVIPGPLLRGLCRFGLGLLPGSGGSGVSMSWRLKRFLRQAAAPRTMRNFNWFCTIDDALKKRLYSPAFLERTRTWPSSALMTDSYQSSDAVDFLGKTLDVDIRTYLPGDLLVKMDIAAMAHSLEGRSPLLDHELMELAARIPTACKLKGLRSKHLLKTALKPLLPDRILNRRKMGFGVPIDAWLRGPLREMAHDVLLGKAARERGLFQVETVRHLLEEHGSGREHHHQQIWALLMLELWFRMFIDGEGASCHA